VDSGFKEAQSTAFLRDIEDSGCVRSIETLSRQRVFSSKAEGEKYLSQFKLDYQRRRGKISCPVQLSIY